jgi:hypothetical protein
LVVILLSFAIAGWIPTPINKTKIPNINPIFIDLLFVRSPLIMEIDQITISA